MIDIATSSTVHVKTWLEIIRNIHPFFSNHSKSFYLRLFIIVLFLSLISNDILAKEVELPLLAPPTLEVQQISPLNNASGIAKNVDINLTLNASIDGTALNSTGIKIWGELSGILDGVWTGAGSSSVTFNPTNDFLLSDVIHIDVTSNLKSTGNIAETPYSAKFSVLSSKLKTIGSWEKTAFPLEIVGKAVDGPKKISFGDINKDGKLDFAVASVNDKTIRKVINTTSGSTVSFSTETIAVNSNDARGVQLVDLDKDGDLDAVYVSSADGKIEWAQNNAGIYTPITIATNVGQFREVAVADIDGDGDNDIVTVSVGNNIVRWYQNDGNQVFTAAAISSNLSNPNSITIANLTKTGNPFIVVTSFADDKVSAYQFKDGAFVTSTAATGIDGAIFTEVGDVNGDGIPEIVSAAFNSNSVFVHSYDSTLNKIGAGTRVATGLTEIQTVRLYDMDGDGDLDIIAAGSGNGLIEWYENDGSGSFTAVSLKIDTSGGNPVHFVVADFTGNGNPDILVANLDNDRIVLYKAVPLVTVISSNPTANSTDVEKNQQISIKFNTDI